MDMRLALLRHWTLYESLLYANYVAVRMHTYNDAGRNKMEDLLVNMGVPLAQSKHSYSASRALLSLRGYSHFDKQIGSSLLISEA